MASCLLSHKQQQREPNRLITDTPTSTGKGDPALTNGHEVLEWGITGCGLKLSHPFVRASNKKRNKKIKNSDSWLLFLFLFRQLLHFQNDHHPCSSRGQRTSDGLNSPVTHRNTSSIGACKKQSKTTRKVFISKLSSRVKIVWWPLMSFHTAGFSFWKLPLLMNTRLLSSPLFSPSTPSHKISWSSGHKEHPLSSCKSSPVQPLFHPS